MIRMPERRADPARRQGRRRGRWGLYLVLGVLAVSLTVGILSFLRRGARPGRSSGDPTGRQDREPAFHLFLPEPTPIPVPELPDWIEEDLLPINEWSRCGEPMEDVTGIVVHYVGNPGTTGRQNRSYFAYLAETHETYASSNFVIGLEGEIILCVPIGEVAYCTSFRNADTLSIEVCHPDSTGKFNKASYDSLVRLVRWLMDFYNLSVDDVIRHYDVTGKECPLYYVKHEDAWEDFKVDLQSGAYAEGNAEPELGVPD